MTRRAAQLRISHIFRMTEENLPHSRLDAFSMQKQDTKYIKRKETFKEMKKGTWEKKKKEQNIAYHVYRRRIKVIKPHF